MKNKIKNNAIILVTSFIIASSIVLLPSEAKADVVGAEECFPAVLMLRGSGEGQITDLDSSTKTYFPAGYELSEPFVETNGHEGERLEKLIQSFVDETDPSKTVSKTRFVGINYDSLAVVPELPGLSGEGNADTAVALITWIDHIVKYNKSYNNGAQAVDQLPIPKIKL